ncbi:IS630 family transposase [Novosphingobium sp. 2638]|uniref:IS630 family transposase n=1 Tax=Novosphingobium beihaiensis TaxID=2930389 RepID=A0ABT0BWC0_9SPHN|nr:IS630 family transposase [Novosphingobium beihaiensis]MCJ2189285.1 IS630 family transposase [Novosphingobium beihaiensis]
MSSRAAGRVVGVSASTAVKWAQRRRATGSVAAGKVGGGKPVVLEAERDWLLARIEQKKDLTLHELLAELREERGVVVCCDTLWRFLKRCGKSFKKRRSFAKEQDRPDVVRRRKRWRWVQRRVDPRRMVFIDETWAKTNMTRTHGWCTKGEALIDKVPHGHWKTLTFIAGLRHDGIIAPCVLDGPINGESFTAWVEQFLIPALEPGTIVVIDNLGSHKGSRVRKLLKAAGIRLFFLPPYSPDLNPIEEMFSKLKRLLGKANERTSEATWRRIGKLLDNFPPHECAKYISGAGYASI